jgi:hypothetical protein
MPLLVKTGAMTSLAAAALSALALVAVAVPASAADPPGPPPPGTEQEYIRASSELDRASRERTKTQRECDRAERDLDAAEKWVKRTKETEARTGKPVDARSEAEKQRAEARARLDKCEENLAQRKKDVDKALDDFHRANRRATGVTEEEDDTAPPGSSDGSRTVDAPTPPHTPEQFVTAGEPGPSATPGRQPAGAPPGPVVQILTPGLQPLTSINHSQPFVIQVTIPRGQDPPSASIDVTLTTPYFFWGSHTLEIENSTVSESTVTYRSPVQYWYRETGFADPIADLTGYKDPEPLYKDLRAANGDVLTVQFDGGTAQVNVYDTWVQQGIASTDAAFDLAQGFYTWLGSKLEGLDGGATVDPDGLAKMRALFPADLQPWELTVLGDGGEISAEQVAQLRASAQQKLSLLPQVRASAAGLSAGDDVLRYFGSVGLFRTLLSDPAGWTPTTGTGYYVMPETYLPLPTAFALAVDGAKSKAKEYVQRGSMDALTSTLVRGYAAFAGVTGGGAVWTLATGTTAMGQRATGWDYFVSAVDIYAGVVISVKAGELGEGVTSTEARGPRIGGGRSTDTPQRIDDVFAPGGPRLGRGQSQAATSGDAPGGAGAGRSQTGSSSTGADDASTVRPGAQDGSEAPTVAPPQTPSTDRLSRLHHLSPDDATVEFNKSLKGTTLTFKDGETVSLEEFGGKGQFQMFFRVRRADGTLDTEYGVKVIVRDGDATLNDQLLGQERLTKIGAPHTPIVNSGVTPEGLPFIKVKLIPADGHMLGKGETLTPAQQHSLFGTTRALNANDHIWSDPNRGNFHTDGDHVSIHDYDFIGPLGQERITFHVNTLSTDTVQSPHVFGPFSQKPAQSRFQFIEGSPEGAQGLFFIQKGAIKWDPDTGRWEKGWADPDLFFQYYSLDGPAPPVPATPGYTWFRSLPDQPSVVLGTRPGATPFGFLAARGLSWSFLGGSPETGSMFQVTSPYPEGLCQDPNILFCEPVFGREVQHAP